MLLKMGGRRRSLGRDGRGCQGMPRLRGAVYAATHRIGMGVRLCLHRSHLRRQL